MHSSNDLRNSTHSNNVCANEAQEPVLRFSFEHRSAQCNINALVHLQIALQRCSFCNIHQPFTIWFTHIRKSWTELLVIGPHKRVIAYHIDVVPDEHNITGTVIRIHAAARITHKKRIGTVGFEHPQRKHNLLHVVAFIVVKTPLHGYNLFATERTEKQFTCMTFYG